MSKVKNRKTASLPKPEIPDIDLTGIKLPVVRVFNPFKIIPLQGQIRERFAGIGELASSIEAMGQMLPVIVTEINGNPDVDAQLVDGERRLEACKFLKRGVIAFIWDGSTDPEDIYAASVAANHGRQNHDSIEILHAITRFHENGKTLQEIATIFGKSQSWVSQYYLLRKLHSTAQNWLIPSILGNGKVDSLNGNPHKKSIDMDAMRSVGSGKIKAPLSFQLALLLCQMPADERQIDAARHIISEKMSLVESRRYITQLLRGRGISAKIRKRSPSERRNTFMSVMDRVKHMLGAYEDMPFNELCCRIFDAMNPSDLNRTVKTLSRIAETATGLARSIQLKIKPEIESSILADQQ